MVFLCSIFRHKDNKNMSFGGFRYSEFRQNLLFFMSFGGK